MNSHQALQVTHGHFLTKPFHLTLNIILPYRSLFNPKTSERLTLVITPSCDKKGWYSSDWGNQTPENIRHLELE